MRPLYEARFIIRARRPVILTTVRNMLADPWPETHEIVTEITTKGLSKKDCQAKAMRRIRDVLKGEWSFSLVPSYSTIVGE